MTVEEVKTRVLEIGYLGARDAEVAHTEEDRLRADVLQAIANGAPNARDLATATLQSSTFDFSRWCA